MFHSLVYHVFIVIVVFCEIPKTIFPAKLEILKIQLFCEQIKVFLYFNVSQKLISVMI